jgi:hypothetical protein
MLKEGLAFIVRIISWPFRALVNLFCPCFDPPEFRKPSPPLKTIEQKKEDRSPSKEKRGVPRSKSEDMSYKHMKQLFPQRTTDELQGEFDRAYKKKTGEEPRSPQTSDEKKKERIRLRLQILSKIPPKPKAKIPSPSPYRDSEPNSGAFFEKDKDKKAEQKVEQKPEPQKKSLDGGLMHVLSSILARKR